MNRAAAVTEIAARLGVMLAEAAIPVTDTAGALKEPIDDALASIGVARSQRATAVVADADQDTYVLELEIATLKTILRVLALRYNTTDEGTSLALSNQFAQVRKLLDDKLAERSAKGWQGTMDLGFTRSTATVDEFGQEDA